MAHIQEARSLQRKLNSRLASEERSLIYFRYFFKCSQNSCLYLLGNIPSCVTRYLTSQQSPVWIMVLTFKQQLQKQNINLLQYSCFQIYYRFFKWNIFSAPICTAVTLFKLHRLQGLLDTHWEPQAQFCFIYHISILLEKTSLAFKPCFLWRRWSDFDTALPSWMKKKTKQWESSSAQKCTKY